MFARIGRIIVIGALVAAIGGHWAVIQSIAWASMLVQFSRQNTLQAAISKTFDGKHPCKLCKIVSSGKKAEKKEDKEVSLQKLNLFACSTDEPFFGPVISIDRSLFAPDLRLLLYSPLSPPPDQA